MSRRTILRRETCRALTLAVALLAALLPTVLATTPALAVEDGVSSLVLAGEPDDLLFTSTKVLTAADRDFTATVIEGGVRVSVAADRTMRDWWHVELAAPRGDELGVGRYERAQRVFNRADGRPGVDVAGDGRGCNMIAGRFTVYDIAVVDDVVVRLHAVFEQHCEAADGALFGEVRYRASDAPSGLVATPSRLEWPSEPIGVAGRSVPVRLTNTSAQEVSVGRPSVAAASGLTVGLQDGCPDVLAVGASCTVDVTVTPTAPGVGSSVVSVPTSLGERKILLGGDGEYGFTAWRMAGDPADPVTAGQEYSYDSRSGRITAGGDRSRVEVGVLGGDRYSFDAVLQAPVGEQLEVGRRYETDTADIAGPLLLVEGINDCRGSVGAFQVHELVVGAYGVERLSATFEQYCDGVAGGLYASVAVRSAEPPHRRPDEPFSDLEGNAHKDAVELIASLGIAQGYPDATYRPHLPVNRGQMALFLDRALELPDAPPAGFSDTAGTAYEQAVDRLTAAGIAGGYADGTYQPAAAVSRGQMAAFLARALDLPPGAPSGFPDTAGTTHEAAIDAIAAAGITAGRADGTFGPSDGVRRDQMATFLARALFG